MSAPSAEEIAARPDLVKAVLKSVDEKVYEHDLEYVLIVGTDTQGGIKIYHSYGKDLPLKDVAETLTKLANMARKAGRTK